jgi:hypothetical protein
MKAPVGTIILAVAVLLFWVLQLAMSSDLASSDAAGNAMAQGFTALELILLWLLLAILVIVACVKGALPWHVVGAALVLLLTSGLAANGALDLLAHPGKPPFLWPMAVTALTAPCLVAFSLWARVPALRATVPLRSAVAITLGGAALASALIFPMIAVREHADAQVAEALAKWEAEFRRLSRDSPLWEWTALLADARGYDEDRVLESVRHLDRRQADAIVMLARGDFPLRFLGRIDLEPNSTLCDAARRSLRERAERLKLPAGAAKSYETVRQDVTDAVVAMQWLVGYDCACDAESRAWEATAATYPDAAYDVASLHDLRDPAQLGRILRERPEHFSQLSPRSHLMAWLSFAGDKSLRGLALAGARVLPHRDDDALDMLNGSEYAAWDLLIYLPELDLDATPALCTAALREVHRELAMIYQPKSDDPRPYRELLGRMGTGRLLPALIWLAGHGCAVGAVVTEAEGLVESYQDSPERAAMLEQLKGLARN